MCAHVSRKVCVCVCANERMRERPSTDAHAPINAKLYSTNTLLLQLPDRLPKHYVVYFISFTWSISSSQCRIFQLTVTQLIDTSIKQRHHVTFLD